MSENWKPLIYKDMDLSDRFLISDNGNVFSLKSKKILKQTTNKSTGYMGFVASLGSRTNKKFIKTHIAVAMNFSSGYADGLVVNHKDGNKQNNQASNLEWVTISENTVHSYQHDLSKNHRRIMCINTGQIFNSVAEACKWCGLSNWSRSITEYLSEKHNRKSAGKHPITKEPLQWKYI